MQAHCGGTLLKYWKQKYCFLIPCCILVHDHGQMTYSPEASISTLYK